MKRLIFILLLTVLAGFVVWPQKPGNYIPGGDMLPGNPGIHLGSFYNVNQPDPSGQMQFHDSRGDAGFKNMYCVNFPCSPPLIFPGVGRR